MAGIRPALPLSSHPKSRQNNKSRRQKGQIGAQGEKGQIGPKPPNRTKTPKSEQPSPDRRGSDMDEHKGGRDHLRVAGSGGPNGGTTQTRGSKPRRKRGKNTSPIGGHRDPGVPRRTGVDRVTRRWSRLPAVVGGGPRSGREEKRRKESRRQTGGGGFSLPSPFPFYIFIYLFIL